MTTNRSRPTPRSTAGRAQASPGVPRIGTKRPVRPALSPRLGRPHLRLKISMVLTLAMLLLLGGRLLQLQGLESTAYAKEGEAQRVRTTLLPAERGAITDRWGKVLARNVETQLVAIDPTRVLPADRDAVAGALSAALGISAATLRSMLDQPGRYVVLARGLDVATERAAMTAKLPGSGVAIPGLTHATQETRINPAGVVGSQVIGVTSQQGCGRVVTATTAPICGQSGIEYTENTLLNGRSGSVTEETDPDGRVIPEGEDKGTPAVQGSDVRLTIDRDVQYEAQTVLDQEVKNTSARGGHIVVMDPRSGELLAIASSPGFDASQWASDTVPTSALTLPAVTDVYEPGSVNKVITAAAALDTGAYSPNDAITVESELHVPGRPQPIRDAEQHGTEHLTFTGVLAESSNIGTVHIAETLGNQTLYKYLTAFGLGSSTKSGLPGESPGLLPNVNTWNASNAATIPFGQGMAATALQIASVYATVANGGVRVQPSIVRGIVAPDGSYTPTKKASGVRVISQQAASTLSTILEAVTTGEGTAPAAAIPGYRIAGKTGTAQALTEGVYDGGYVSSFVGFAPADKPRLVVSVVLDHPQGSYFGGAVAAPVFRAVMGYALRTYKVAPTGTRRPQLRLTYDTPTAPVAPVTAVTSTPTTPAAGTAPTSTASPPARPAGSAATSP